MKQTVKEWVKQEQGKHICQCGCKGKIIIKPHHHNVGIPNFIRGHRLEIYNKVECFISKDILYKLHHIDLKPIIELSKIFNVSDDIIRRWFRELNIKILSHTRFKKNQKAHNKIKCPISEEHLYILYHVDNKTTTEIGNIYNVSFSTVIRWLNDYDIEIKRKNNEYDINITDEERQEKRTYLEYKEWRKAVYERDNYTCQECGFVGYIIAHHIRPYRDCNKKEKVNINNGITLCKKCHKKTIWNEYDFMDKYLKLIGCV